MKWKINTSLLGKYLYFRWDDCFSKSFCCCCFFLHQLDIPSHTKFYQRLTFGFLFINQFLIFAAKWKHLGRPRFYKVQEATSAVADCNANRQIFITIDQLSDNRKVSFIFQVTLRCIIIFIPCEVCKVLRRPFDLFFSGTYSVIF